MSQNKRVALFFLYVIAALAVPVSVVVFPGEPALRVNTDLVRVSEAGFDTPRLALGEGAESYDLDVLADLPERLAAASAVYPDGSSVVVARFSQASAAQAALIKLVDMVPHKVSVSDLWATRFQSDSGEFIVLSAVDDVLVFIIADTEESSQLRLATLPVFVYNPEPGFGAMLANGSILDVWAWLLAYGLFQWVSIFRLGCWATKRVPKEGVVPVGRDELRQCLHQLADEALPFTAFDLANGDIHISWKHTAAMRAGLAPANVVSGLYLVLDSQLHTVRAVLQRADLSNIGVGDEVLEGDQAVVADMLWRSRHHLPLCGANVAAMGVHWGGEHLHVEVDYQFQYQAKELYAAVGEVVTAHGWRFRPVLNGSKFLCG